MQPEPEDRGARATCEAARAEIASFVHASPGAERSRFLRAHLERCADCASSYRSALEQAARVGRSLRTERVERERERRHDELVRLSRGASLRPRRAWLKAFLVTCGLVFLLSQVSRLGFGARLHAREPVGRVAAAGAPLLPGRTFALARGDVCATGPDGRVVLAGEEVELALGPDTVVLVEEAGGPSGPRVRLQQGTLEARGGCVVTTPLGVVTVARGTCAVALEPDALVARCADGAAQVAGPLGARALTAGGKARLSL